MARVALVTGGTGGIGTAICVRLAKDGCTVIANHRSSEAEAVETWRAERAAEGIIIETIAGDVASFEDSARMIAEVEASHGPVDILVNCAGITRDKSFKKMEPAQWEAVINVNLNSVFNVTRQIWEGMLERGWGRVINISSVNGQRGQFGQANYSAAKAGMHGFTMALAQEGAAKGVTVNTVSPGYVETAMTLAMDDGVRNAIISGVPMRRAPRKRSPLPWPFWRPRKAAMSPAPTCRSTAVSSCIEGIATEIARGGDERVDPLRPRTSTESSSSRLPPRRSSPALRRAFFLRLQNTGCWSPQGVWARARPLPTTRTGSPIFMRLYTSRASSYCSRTHPWESA